MSDVCIDWTSFATGFLWTVAWHPVVYTQVLIQLGHEPLKPELSRNMFFHEQHQYPNILRYLMYIKETEGYIGLYRGLVPRVCYKCVDAVSNAVFSVSMGVPLELDESDVIAEQFNLELFKHTFKETVIGCLSVVISHPFHVITIRCMAQFVGQETIYNTLFSSVKHIYKSEGLGGFFEGLASSIAYEIFDIWMTNYFLRAWKILVEDEPNEINGFRSLWKIIMNYRYFSQQISYPLLVTNTIMVVKGSKLKVENPPYVGFKYNGWIDCLHKVYSNNYSERGSSFFFRRAYPYLGTAAANENAIRGYSIYRAEFEILSHVVTTIARCFFFDILD